MAIVKITESYGINDGRLISNVGDWTPGKSVFTQRSIAPSSISNTCTYLTPMTGVFQLTFSNFDWASKGFGVGDILECDSSVPTHTKTIKIR